MHIWFIWMNSIAFGIFQLTLEMTNGKQNEFALKKISNKKKTQSNLKQ